MIQINSNSIITNSNLVAISSLSDEMVNNINLLRDFLIQTFNINRISQLFIDDDKIIVISRGLQFTLLNTQLNENKLDLLNTIKENLNN